ncbi:hypothetical protein HPAKL117_03405 [Helicobacter pylori Aklavik117]|uniref:hypothetical protein n=1 Tax=Helicobacter pylori TaxID=210 RepID=UPI00029D017F|nr:hypothetical protein [Helicobacter pylori]AFX91092.1 hypothetical protein HPAKL117_03405 [Helicobacter pylori Aklavik117]
MAYTYNQNSEMSILARVFNTAVFSNDSAFDIYVPTTIKVPILKTSPAYKIWLNARMQNPILGECVLKDDESYPCVIKQVTLNFNVIDLVTSVEFTIKGNFYVNQDLIKFQSKNKNLKPLQRFKPF